MEDNTMPAASAPEPLRPDTISFEETDISERYNDVYELRTPNGVTHLRWVDGAYEFVCQNTVALRIYFLSKHILRFRYTPERMWERDFSYAISPDFQPEKTTVSLSENAHEYTLSGEALQVVVAKNGLKVRIFNQDDQLVYEDAEGYSARRTVMQGWDEVKLTYKCHKKAVFYGLGDKASAGASLYGKRFSNWCTDAYAFGEDSNEMYRAIPFYYSVQAGIAQGIFLDNTFRTAFDFDSNGTGEVELSAEGGEINFYFLYGPTLTEVAMRYHELTGVHELPPMWALGYHQCRWSYYPEARVKALADTFRNLRIPCDAIYLDIDYMDGYRCFTWNRDYFPDPGRMVETLKALGFHTVAMIDPGIKEEPDYQVYREGIEQGFFVKTADGAVAKGPVWPGFCAFPDYTRPKVREWWGHLYKDMYNKLGISGFWNDMNEPAVFFVNQKTLPNQVMHHYEGAPCSHKKAHNIYGMQMMRASYEGLVRLQPEKRPFLLGRATYAGGQRYGAVWTGDNCATWEHLQIANIQCQRLAISGFSFCGTDIGGFSGEPDGELYTRWLQLSVFHPLMRTHSMGQHTSGDAIDYHEAPGAEHPELADQGGQEPWSYGERWTPVARMAIELRYCMIPSLYTGFWLLKNKGLPLIRHAAFEDQNDPKLANEDRDFLFGEHLFVSPVVQSKVQRQMVYLPPGNWYYFWNGLQCHGEVFITVAPDQIPFFVREGAVMVTYPVRQHTAEPIEEVTFYCYFKEGKETSYWYEDAGEGKSTDSVQSVLSAFSSQGAPDKYILLWEKTSRIVAECRKIKIYLIGFPTFARKCIVDGVEMPVREIRLRDRSLYTLTMEKDFDTISWEA